MINTTRKPDLKCVTVLVLRTIHLDEQGDLRPNYRPAPLVASFMREPGVLGRESIPVPKGPVEVW